MSGLRQNQGDEDLIADTPNALITYRGEIPPEIQAALEPLLEKYKCLLPAWVHHLNIQYIGNPPEDSPRAVAQTTVDYQYRTAYFDIYPGFLFTNEDKRWEFVQHEMVHVTWNPLYNYAQEAIKKLFEMAALKDNKALKDLILEELKSRNESSTTDMQKIIADLMARPSAPAAPASG